MNSEFFNVHSIEVMSGLGIFTMTQFNDHSHPDFTQREQEAFSLAEELAAKGQPVVVKKVLHGTGCNSLIWQSFNSKGRTGLLQR